MRLRSLDEHDTGALYKKNELILESKSGFNVYCINKLSIFLIFIP